MFKVVSREFTSTRFEIYQSHDLRWLEALCYECGNWVANMDVVGDTLRIVGCYCRTRDIDLEETISASGLSLSTNPKLRSNTLGRLIDGNCQISTEGVTDGGVNIYVFQWIAFWAGVNVLSIDINSNSNEVVA
jgi:hypothetical protein